MLATISLNATVPAGLLGISTSDAISFGMMVLAVLVYFKGQKQGDAAKQEAIKGAMGVSIAGGIIDANQFADYVKTADKLAIALTKHANAMTRLHRVKHTNRLEQMAEEIDRLRAEIAERN